MSNIYLFNYVNEAEFRKSERALKKHNMKAYKKLYFEYYPLLKSGNFLGNLISINQKNSIKKYELELPTDELFSKVHGNIKLYYFVDEKEKNIILCELEPIEILRQEYASELVTYKGVMVSKENAEKDMFKINLLDMLDK